MSRYRLAFLTGGIALLAAASPALAQSAVADKWRWLTFLVFGLIIALSGCFQGMQVEGNAEEVGARTTAAVVQAIFLVIVLDAFFAVFFTAIGWI